MGDSAATLFVARYRMSSSNASLSSTKTRSGRPVMVLLDLLGRRWTLRVLWELRGDRCLSFRDLQAASGGLSPTVLNRRLRELRAAGVVEHAEGYRLSAAGRSLLAALAPLDEWARQWGEVIASQPEGGDTARDTNQRRKSGNGE